MDERSVAAYEYALPQALIAQAPAALRDASRLLVAGENGALEDKRFSDLPDVLRDGDVLVLNETRVIAARLRARRESGGSAELLLLHPANGLAYDAGATSWVALVRPAKRVREGSRLDIVDAADARVAGAEVVACGEDGERELRFDDATGIDELLQRAGRLPLPPYIHNESDVAQERYQTVFARVPGSVAAPTAALHFTPALLEAIATRGVEVVKLALDVGLGTFRPMHAERIDEHAMHAERYSLPAASADRILRAREEGRRVVAVGTTVVRALEGNAAAHGTLRAGEFETSLFITPGFRFRLVDALVTNFHLPRSTLLVLVSAFAGRERVLAAYEHAIAQGYRFFSFGDAMFLARSGGSG